MKGYCIIVFSIFLSLVAKSQVTVTAATPLQAAQILTNGNSSIQITSSTFPGIWPLQQLGLFSGQTPPLPSAGGVLLTTGDISIAGCINQPNQTAPCGPQYWSVESNVNTSLFDSDLQMVSAGGQFDPLVWNIEFVAYTTSFEFKYIFASEEYKEYINTPYNDAFAFFLSGPGISGPYSGGAINLATVPNTNPAQAVNVQNINHLVNSTYFVDNNCRLFPGPDGLDPCPYPNFSYDGFTRGLSASYSGLVCGETYNLKLVLSNINDFRVGSAVFIEAGSFRGNFNAGPATASPNPACEGQTINLSCAGDPSYSYTWFSEGTGQQIGTGQNITTTVTQAALPYYVIVVDPNGCANGIKIYTQDVTLYTPVNQPPYTMGINDEGSHSVTATAGQELCFNINSYDADNERVEFTTNFTGSGIPVNVYSQTSVMTPLNNLHFGGNYCWTPTSTDVGEHCFLVNLMDNNPCDNPNQSGAQEEFCITVVCPGCPTDIYIEDQSPTNNPLPILTESASFIKAGFNVDPSNGVQGNVIVGASQNVTFRAAQAVYIEDGFIVDAGATFVAEISPINCESNCENWCCADFDEFPSSLNGIYIPNIFFVNSPWVLTDQLNPDCPFWGASGYKIKVWNKGNSLSGCVVDSEELVYENTVNFNVCCGLSNPNADGSVPSNAVFWDGEHNKGPCRNKGYNSPAAYEIELTLYGCGISKTYIVNQTIGSFIYAQ